MFAVTPREKRRDKNRQAILKAARKLIVEKGLDGLSLRELARRVDYSPAALYEYFGSKDEIIAAIGLEALERLGHFLRRVPENLAPPERLVQLGLAYLDFARQDPELYTRILPHFPPAVTSWNELLEGDSPYLVLMQTVKRGIEARDFIPQRGYGLEEMTYSCWALVHGMAMLENSNLRRLQGNFGNINRSVIEAFVQGLKSKKAGKPNE